MKLIIAEKPSLARSVAKVIGVVKEHKDKGYLECKDGFCVTWVFGHIIELVKPEVYNPQNKLFRMDNLPIIPDNWQYQAKPSSKAQYNNIKELLKSATMVINCGDPDREGQLLIDELLIHWNNKKPVKRLLILDPKDAGIRKSLANMEDNSKYYSWYQAGLLRTQADWLIGYNFTPAFTILGKKLGIDGVISMGRVQTPTLKLIYDREMAVRNYKPLSFYNLYATFKTANNQQFSAKLDFTGLSLQLDSEERLLDDKQFHVIISAIANKQGTISKYEVKDCETSQPLPFELSELQAIANAKLGLGADEVLKVAQSLYEKQLTTYPRSACAYLPESLHADAQNILNALASIYPSEASMADSTIKSRAFNDKQLGGESHFAIIPTGETKILTSLSTPEQAVYRIIAMQYIAQFYPPVKYQQTTGIVSCANYNFSFSGKVIKDLGWKQLFNKAEDVDTEAEDANNNDNQALPPLTLRQSVSHNGNEVKKSTTTKPKPYTEGTLIKAMANIHNELDSIVQSYYPDKETASKVVGRYKVVLKETAGLGTVATRAATIDKLKEREYVIVVKKKITMTEKGIAVMQLLTKDDNLLNYSVLTSPLTTAMYEQQLDEVLNHKLTAEKFTQIVHSMIHEKITSLKSVNSTIADSKPQAKLTGKKCPECGSDIVERVGKFGPFETCSNYPKCKWTPPKAERPKAEASGKKCEKCGSDMVKRKSKDGTSEFLACSGFPKCKNIQSI